MKKTIISLILIIVLFISVLVGAYFIENNKPIKEDIQISINTKKWVDEYELKYYIYKEVTFKNIFAGDEYNFAISSSDELYTWGKSRDNLDFASKTPKIFDKLNYDIIDFFGNNHQYEETQKNNHFLALTSDNRLFGWGSNYYNQVGINSDLNIIDSPTEITYFKENNIKIVKITGGDALSFAISDDGRLFGWGINYYYKMGVGNDDYEAVFKIPTQIIFPGNAKIKNINILTSAVVAQSFDDKIFVWGSDDYGGLGHEDYQLKTPHEIKLPNNIKPKKIVSGKSHVLALGNDKKLYGWGINYSSQLGISSQTRVILPKLLNHAKFNDIKDIFAGFNQSGIIRQNNELYFFGYNKDYQIHDNRSEKLTPRKINIGNLVFKNISFGRYHTLLTDEKNEIYSFGNNKNNGIGRKNSRIIVRKPEKIKPEGYEVVNKQIVYQGYDFQLYEYISGNKTINKWYIDKELKIEFSKDLIDKNKKVYGDKK